MSTTESSGLPASARAPRIDPGDAPLDAEGAARRALGVVMNPGWTAAGDSPLPPLPSRLVAEAQALMRAQVPAGDERESAIALLERSARRVSRR